MTNQVWCPICRVNHPDRMTVHIQGEEPFEVLLSEKEAHTKYLQWLAKRPMSIVTPNDLEELRNLKGKHVVTDKVVPHIPTVPEVLEAAAETFRQRQPIYGDNWLNYGPAVQALFPKGVNLKTADDHARFQLFCLIMVKWSRYAENFNQGGHEDSTHDNITYTAMLHQLDRKLWESDKAALEETFVPHVVRRMQLGANDIFVGDIVIYTDPKTGAETKGKVIDCYQDGEFVLQFPYTDTSMTPYTNKIVKWGTCRHAEAK